jgi:L-cysteine/cystine lyase
MATVLGALELRPGDEVLTSDEEHPGLLTPLAAARRRGIRVRVVPVDALADAISPRTRLIACSHVTWRTGCVVDAEGLRASGRPLLLDGAQALGAIPVDVAALGCDFYAASGQKWLCGPDGIGYLWVNPDRAAALWPASPAYSSLVDPHGPLDLKLHPDARQFDSGWTPRSLAAAALAALDVVLPLSPATAIRRAADLATRLEEAGLTVAPRGPSTIVAWDVRDACGVAQRLADEGVLVRAIPERGMLRASVGAWTGEDDLERVIELCASEAAERPVRGTSRANEPRVPLAPTVFYSDPKVVARYAAARRQSESPNRTLEEPSLLELLGDVRGRDILDIGCGDAWIGRHALDSGAASYVGVDASAPMLALARDTLSGTTGVVLLADVERWAPEPGEFDLCVSRLLLHHVRDLPRLFERVHAALRGGGAFVFSIEHPVITAACDENPDTGIPRQWTISRYFRSGERGYGWLESSVLKHHRPLEIYLENARRAHLRLDRLSECIPDPSYFTEPSTHDARLDVPRCVVVRCERPERDSKPEVAPVGMPGLRCTSRSAAPGRRTSDGGSDVHAERRAPPLAR